MSTRIISIQLGLQNRWTFTRGVFSLTLKVLCISQTLNFNQIELYYLSYHELRDKTSGQTKQTHLIALFQHVCHYQNYIDQNIAIIICALQTFQR